MRRLVFHNLWLLYLPYWHGCSPGSDVFIFRWKLNPKSRKMIIGNHWNIEISETEKICPKGSCLFGEIASPLLSPLALPYLCYIPHDILRRTIKTDAYIVLVITSRRAFFQREMLLTGISRNLSHLSVRITNTPQKIVRISRATVKLWYRHNITKQNCNVDFQFAALACDSRCSPPPPPPLWLSVRFQGS